jgi:hypothetical protein
MRGPGRGAWSEEAAARQAAARRAEERRGAASARRSSSAAGDAAGDASAWRPASGAARLARRRHARVRVRQQFALGG